MAQNHATGGSKDANLADTICVTGEITGRTFDGTYLVDGTVGMNQDKAHSLSIVAQVRNESLSITTLHVDPDNKLSLETICCIFQRIVELFPEISEIEVPHMTSIGFMDARTLDRLTRMGVIRGFGHKDKGHRWNLTVNQ